MDTLAIKETEVGAMQAAIETYTQNVETEIKKISDFAIDGAGIYGSKQVETVNTYIDNTCTQIGTIVRYFDEFKNALEKVASAYADKQSKISTSDVVAAKQANADDMIHVNFND